MHTPLEIIPDAPWWVNATVVIIGMLIPILIMQVKARIDAAHMERQITEVHAQTVNDHQTVNFRAQFDVVETQVQHIADDVRTNKAEMGRANDAILNINKTLDVMSDRLERSISADRERADRVHEAMWKRLDECREMDGSE